MSAEPIVMLKAPPLPYYLGSGFTEYEPGEQHPNRKNLGFFDLLIVVKGELYIGENGREWALGEGETLLLLPEGEHYATKPCDRKTSFYWVHFDHAGPYGEEPESGHILQPAAEQPFANPYSVGIPKRSALADPAAAADLLRRLVGLSSHSRSDAYWKEQSQLLELLEMLEHGAKGELAPPPVRLAERTEAYIKQHYRSDLTNETLAEALHFHPNYVVRCMKARYRKSPMEYLHEYRLEQAKRLLVTTAWSVAQIAEHVGFRHAPYFSGCFKRSFGISPLRFRKMYLN